MQSITIGKNQAGQRFDKFLHKYLPNADNGFLYKMLRKKNITLNGQKADGKEILAEGDIVKFFFSDETFSKFSRQSIQQGQATSIATIQSIRNYEKAYRILKNITVLYEDEHIVALNKPVGVLTQKATDEDLSLNEWLIGYLLHTGGIAVEELHTFRPSVCNRLDRNTSGLVLCGKSLKGSQYLSRIIKEHTLRKFYYTICEGIVSEEILLEGYLKKDEKTNTVTIFSNKVQDSDYIKTIFTPLKTGVCESKQLQATLLSVELFTGKTHQIRAHLQSIGHSIIGDRKYGSANNKKTEAFGLKNQLLHAHHVIFPESEEFPALSGITITAPCPKQFMNIANVLHFQDILT